jgi:glycosyltransferase involved in cell wall biosynthesis
VSLPRISIVTPSFNQAPYIGWTVRSILLQRYPDLEYIVMDGGSTDETMEVLDRYRHRLAHLQSGPDGGQSAAIHDGFTRATGQIMAWINSDDLLAPGALRFVADFFRDHPDVDVVYSHRCIVDEVNEVTGYWILPRHSNYKMLRWDLIPQETCFWRRSIFERCGSVDPSFRFAMDYDLFARFMLRGRLARVPRVLGVFRRHAESKTTQQMDSIGQEEVGRVHRTYGITFSGRDRQVGQRFWYGMHLRSALHARRRRPLPGAFRGIGYNYDAVWGGLLRDERLPPRVAAVPAIAAGGQA